MRLSISETFTFFAPYKGIRIPESGKFLLVESKMRGFGILNTAQGIQNSTDDWYRIQVPLSETGIQYLESRIRGVESRIQNPRLSWISLYGETL